MSSSQRLQHYQLGLRRSALVEHGPRQVEEAQKGLLVFQDARLVRHASAQCVGTTLDPRRERG